jgi:pyrroline-5-carboxylate reductase
MSAPSASATVPATAGPLRLAFIGGGAMARAIMEGARRASGPEDQPVFLVAEPDPARRAELATAGLARTVPAAEALIGPVGRREVDGVVLAVKPQAFPGVAGELRDAGGLPSTLAISVMAGTRIATIAAALFGEEGIGRVIRVMPNTPARVGLACSAIASGPTASAADRALAQRLFAGVGTTLELAEDLMDAFTAVAGSGPAFVFAYAEAMIRAAVGVGIDPAQADAIVRQVIAGSAALMQERVGGAMPEIAGLRRAVTSPGGTTAAGLAQLETAGFAEAIMGAVIAARDRGRALSGGETAPPALGTNTVRPCE